ncbi:MAG: leucine--tRNA ligase, partial [Ruminococcaceae bacterium]|nr:leucine--tRNA ligase [Oscillospiraceae bacterium]
RHLIYSRFWHRFLYDLGVVPCKEPYQKRSAQGMILGADGVKMSKSRGNVVDPNDVVEESGADTLRIYILFMGDYGSAAPWNESSLKGCKRFLDRMAGLVDMVKGEGVTAKLESAFHKTIKKVSSDIEEMKFNTAVAAMMTLLNQIYDHGSLTKDELMTLARLLCPFAPHLSGELWEQMGGEGLCSLAAWPTYDESKTVDATVEIAVQVNGKLKDRLTIPADADTATVLEAVKKQEKIAALLDGMQIVKELYVPAKLVNLVIKPQ